jgi:outer membrane protein OmpA-like peptidoglycan-associated protein
LNVELQGSTSTLGEEAYNLTLSEKRATQAKEYLVSKGINVSRLKAKGYGETNTIGDQNTEEGRAKSRRTIVKVAK